MSPVSQQRSTFFHSKVERVGKSGAAKMVNVARHFLSSQNTID